MSILPSDLWYWSSSDQIKHPRGAPKVADLYGNDNFETSVKKFKGDIDSGLTLFRTYYKENEHIQVKPFLSFLAGKDKKKVCKSIFDWCTLYKSGPSLLIWFIEEFNIDLRNDPPINNGIVYASMEGAKKQHLPIIKECLSELLKRGFEFNMKDKDDQFHPRTDYHYAQMPGLNIICRSIIPAVGNWSALQLLHKQYIPDTASDQQRALVKASYKNRLPMDVIRLIAKFANDEIYNNS